MFLRNGDTPIKAFDCHVHIGFCEKAIVKRADDLFVSIEEVMSYLDRNKIQKALVFPFPNRETPASETNEYVVQCIEREKIRLYGLIFFSWDNYPRKMQRFARPNIVGIKIHPTFSQRSLEEVPDIFLEIVRENKWILLIDSSISDLGHPAHIVKFAKNNPDIFIICAHMARLFHKEILEMTALKNVYLDISGICLLSKHNHRLAPPIFRHASLVKNPSPQQILEYLLHFVGKEKLIWGSDFPFPKIFAEELNSEITFALRDIFFFLDRKICQDILNGNMEFLLKRRKFK